MITDNIISNLKVAVENKSLLPSVLEYLLPEGKPFSCEGQLWDYKLKIPVLCATPSQAEKDEQRLAIAELVKDAVSFHNAYGGYIVFGVRDKGDKRIVGVEGDFNCGDFNKTLQRYAGISIECLYNVLDAPTSGSPPIRVGILLIPRRAPGAVPIRFVRKGPDKLNGKPCFSEDIYVRIRDECRAATNTHEDWMFLHSDRQPPDTIATAASPIKSYLPARDEDLISFVGRTEHLASLRKWITDIRSPVRLITGIGGLGKTTLAYRFAEEISSVGAGGVEAVIWLTAKQQTFSPLRGKMVPVNRVDFSDIPSLFKQILKFLNYEFPVEEDDPTPSEVIDRVIEALSMYPAMIVVDDLDTLPPDDQKETVAALNSLALRTVGRELPPSRILMTSRLDQGLPLTSIIKIHGLDRDEFKLYFENVTDALGVGRFRKAEVDEIFRASSGSPLFAASILRLVKLGEDSRDVVVKWEGADGEEVRSFAFKRELSRLSQIQTRIIYSVMLLGETNLADIAEVLDMSPRVVRDQISELQAYHLISTITREGREGSVRVPSELQAVVNLVRDQLGNSAQGIDEAVARAHAKGGNQEQEIGLGIRSIARDWNENRSGEALIEALKLSERFPDNADVASVLGAAYIKNKPPKMKEADRALERAIKLGCRRPELLANVIQAKTALEDWSGIWDFTKDKASNEFNRDQALSAYLMATEQLIKISRLRGDYRRHGELALAAVERITGKIRRTRVEQTYFAELSRKNFEFGRAYIEAIERQCSRPGDRIAVFEATVRLSSADILLSDLIRKGFSSLEVWWSDVERRSVIDAAACKILHKMLAKLAIMQQRLVDINGDAKLVDEVHRVHRDLEFRGAALQALLG